MDEVFIPCGPWLPDQPDYNNPGCNVADNVYPRTKSTYAPMPSFKTVAHSPLSAKPLAAFSAVDLAGNPGTYAGTASKLYVADNGTAPNFVDASGAQTFTADTWSFTVMKGAVYASNGTDPMQSIATATTGSFAAVGANAPKAKVLAVVQPGYLLAGNINDVTVGLQPQGIRWSALQDGTDWPLVGSQDAVNKGSDWQPLFGPYGEVKAIAAGLTSCAAAIFMDEAIFQMIYTGDSKIFALQVVEKARGTPAGKSVVQYGQIAYYLGQDGWYAFDGTTSLPIGSEAINITFFQDADPNYISTVAGVCDPINGLCFWSYAGTGNNNGAHNRVLVYNAVINRWSRISNFSGEALFIGRSFGTSLDNIFIDLGYTLDNLPFSLDSAILAGGRIVLAGFDSTHTLGFFSGPNMAFSVETTEKQIARGGRARVGYVRPMVEGDLCSAAVGARSALSTPTVYGLTTPPNLDGICPARGEGRYHRAMLSGAAGSLVTHIQGANMGASAAGGR